MSTENFILIACSLGLGLLCIWRLQWYDLHETEPFTKMFFVTLLGGFVSVVVALLLYRIVPHGWRNLFLHLHMFSIVAPIEEFAKLIGLIACYRLIRRQMNEPVDGMIYMACVALGFSLVENYFYAVGMEDHSLLVLRLLICTPGHIFFSAYMGLAFYAVVKLKLNLMTLVIAFLVAVFMHGCWNWFLSQKLGGLIFPIMIALFFLIRRFTLRRLEEVTAISPFRKSLRQFIEDYSGPKQEKGLECLHCNGTHNKQTYRLGSIVLQKCDRCRHFVTTKKSLGEIFRHFAGRFLIGYKEKKQYFRASPPEQPYSTLVANNYVSDKKNLAYFDLDALSETLDQLSREKVDRAIKTFWLPNVKMVEAEARNP
ncbi:MAG: PrsW family intramembrane metalloprotease [Phycisphaerae bacterium]|nr:PrsW family intramembrane metalloprotease [Phycisphaerae bacterium]